MAKPPPSSRKPLPPVAKQVGFFPEFTQHDKTMVLKVREGWGDDFSVKDAFTKQPIFRCDASPFSFQSEKKTIFSAADGKPLYTIKKVPFCKTWTVETPDKKATVCEVDYSRGFFDPKISVRVNNKVDKGKETTLNMNPDFFDEETNIDTEPGKNVGRITRNFFSAGELFADKQTYYLEIPPGVDAALLVAVTICFDEARHD